MSSIELPEGYRYQTSLASGEYSMLFTALGKEYEEVVIKSFDCTQLDEMQISEIHRQALLLKTVNHPSILKVQDVEMNPTRTRLHVIMEPFFKTLQDLIDECTNTGRSLLDDIVCQVAYQIIKGLHYLSTTNHVAFNEQGHEFSQDKIFHSFITPRNIVFDSSGVVKIMGIFPIEHKMLYEKGDLSFPELAYASPEFLNSEYAECPADVWSAGACIFALAMHRPPFVSTDLESLKIEVEEGKKESLDVSFSPELDAMLSRMLTPDQSYRPTASELIQDPSIFAAGNDIDAGNLQNPWMAIGFSRPASQAVPMVVNDSPVPVAVDPNIIYPIAFDDENPWERYWLKPPQANITIDASSYTKGTIGEEDAYRLPTPPPEEDMYADSGAPTREGLPVYADLPMECAERVPTPLPEDHTNLDAGIVQPDDEAYKHVDYALNSTFGAPPVESVMGSEQVVTHEAPAQQIEKRSYAAASSGVETAPESSSVTRIMNAVRSSNVPLIRDLISTAPDELRWKTPREQRTALMLAADFGNAEAVAALAPHEYGEVDADGWRAIDYAAQNGNVDAVRTLIEYEGDMPSMRKDGCTPLFQAVFWNKPECVKILASKYARMATTAHYWQGEGFTALMEAAKCCRTECVEILAPHEVNMVDKKGKTALDHCREAWDHILDDTKKEACLRILQETQREYA